MNGLIQQVVQGKEYGEITNKEIKELCEKQDIDFLAGPPYSPWSNGCNERKHYSCDLIVKKLIAEDPKIKLQSAINKAAWAHNTNTAATGFAPITIATGQGCKITTYGMKNIDSVK